MLTAVLARPPKSSETSFLALSGTTPRLTDNPGVLKVCIPFGTENPQRTLISLQRPGPGGAFLSLSGGKDRARLKNVVSKRELFHLEIVPGTLGKGFVNGPFDHNLPRLTSVEALSHAVLELGVRFRLRSAHSRVLRRGDGDQNFVAVVQNGPKTSIQETHEKELLFSGFRVDGAVSGSNGHMRALFVIKDVESGKVLSVSKSNIAQSRAKTLCESAAALIPEGNAVSPLCVQSRQVWGGIYLGNVKMRGGDEAGAVQVDEWLMAGPKGRLEVRTNRSSWESFTIEFVRQSFAMAINELPESPLYAIASETTRSNIRSEIAARVGKEEPKAASTLGASSKKKKTGGMDYSAALAGLAEPPKVPVVQKSEGSAAKTSKSASKNASSKAGTKGKGQPAAVSAAAAAAATSALPRNQANRKAAKRRKKKQKAKNAKRNAAAAHAKGVQAAASGATAGGSKSVDASNTTDKSPDAGKSTVPPDDSSRSSSKESSQGGSGPPCAACGRMVEGTYTTALGKNFHPHCFCCGKCRRPMGAGAGQFRERGGIPYCQACYAAHLASRCARCSEPIMDTVITAMEKTWHKACLTCTICRLPLTQTFWLYADKPNEPRCSRCVTGSEEYNGRGNASGRMVNLPMFGRNNRPSLPVGNPTAGAGSSAAGGRARLMNPVLPATTRR
ncbi:unnamed protein product [Chondrus crispus]|uniref:LIM zinc-binding domain-containing protein n=1 Tax=Chondrus crispus TaxID=2769 RepID=R7QUT7_CHOCR|nr:unnamed protein product [Chondrus crispus]CDF41110.1 unnamed protein product [Chondrus crispus]|eukprot:XP_005711404.1 unnamed protein product [Chondrus crispus]